MPTIYDVEKLLKGVVAERDLLRQKCEVLGRLSKAQDDLLTAYRLGRKNLDALDGIAKARAELAALDKWMKGDPNA